MPTYEFLDFAEKSVDFLQKIDRQLVVSDKELIRKISSHMFGRLKNRCLELKQLLFSFKMDFVE